MAKKKILSPQQQLRKAKAAANLHKHERAIALACKAAEMPEPVKEHRFHPLRKWRFDYAWPDLRLAIEINGGGHRGRHNTVMGATRDSEKLNAAAISGWVVLVYTVVSIKQPLSIAADLVAFRLMRVNNFQ